MDQELYSEIVQLVSEAVSAAFQTYSRPEEGQGSPDSMAMMEDIATTVVVARNESYAWAEGVSDSKPSCYDIVDIDLENRNITFSNPYYSIGGRTYEGPDSSSVNPPCVFALQIDTTSGEAVFNEFSNVSSLQQDQENMDRYIIPLYEFDSEGKMICDFRNMQLAAMGEF